MKLKPKGIRSEADYEAALARIEEIFNANPGTPEGDELEWLVRIVERYEEQDTPISLPDPVAAIRFRMEQAGLKQKDLAPYIGSQSKVSEVLSGQRSLSKSMIRNLIVGLGIPAEVLLQPASAEPNAQSPKWIDLHFRQRPALDPAAVISARRLREFPRMKKIIESVATSRISQCTDGRHISPPWVCKSRTNLREAVQPWPA